MPLEVLVRCRRLRPFDLLEELHDRYGGSLGFDDPRLVAIFVSSIDGVVVVPPIIQPSKLISGRNDSDRFVMTLLACLRRRHRDRLGHPGGARRDRSGCWHALYPATRTAFADLRHRRCCTRGAGPPRCSPASGSIDPGHPALERGALVLTTDGDARHLDGRLPQRSEVVSLGAGLGGRPRPRARAPARARLPADPLRGRAARVRRPPLGRARRRALPHGLADSRRPIPRHRAPRARRRPGPSVARRGRQPPAQRPARRCISLLSGHELPRASRSDSSSATSKFPAAYATRAPQRYSRPACASASDKGLCTCCLSGPMR